MVDVIREVLDDGGFMEVQADWAQNIVCGFGHLGGRTVGVVANQPKVLAGLPGHRCLGQGGTLRALLRRVQHPAGDLRRRAGFLPGTSQEWGGIIRHGAKLLYAFAEATVPKLTVVLRKAYGGAYDVMSPSTCAAITTWRGRPLNSRSWAPTARLRSSTGGASPTHETPNRRERLTTDFNETFANPYKAASLGYLDDVIEPRRPAGTCAEPSTCLQTRKNCDRPASTATFHCEA